MKTDVFDGLEPAGLWRRFQIISEIARPSGQEQLIAESIRTWAASHGFQVRTDQAGNLCVRVPATPGRERAPIVVLQGHLDMVVANSANAPPGYDAALGRLSLIRKRYEDDEYIESEFATLGADNGIAIAIQCAIAEDRDAPHGELELLMTVEEEIGLVGAGRLDPSLVRGRLIINLDSEDDDELFVGCAGGTDSRIRWTRPPYGGPWRLGGPVLGLGGLRGGHSGTEIDKNRLNANKALARLIEAAGDGRTWRLASIEGGDRRNAIARSAAAVVWVAPADVASFRDSLQRAVKSLAEQYRVLEPNLEFLTDPAPAAEPGSVLAFSHDDSRVLVDLLRAVPVGVILLSQDLPGLVETSNNLGILRTEGDSVEIVCGSRSSVAPAMEDLIGTLAALARLAGAEHQVLGSYPGWDVNLDSRVLHVAQAAYRRLFGEEPRVNAIHAGLEAGVLEVSPGR